MSFQGLRPHKSVDKPLSTLFLKHGGLRGLTGTCTNILGSYGSVKDFVGTILRSYRMPLAYPKGPRTEIIRFYGPNTIISRVFGP